MEKYTFITEKHEVRFTGRHDKPEGEKFLTYRIMVEVYGEPAGWAIVCPFRNQLNDLFIEERFRGEGVGTKLMRYILHPDRWWGINNLQCVALNDTDPFRLKNFYEHFGFRMTENKMMVRK